MSIALGPGPIVLPTPASPASTSDGSASEETQSSETNTTPASSQADGPPPSNAPKETQPTTAAAPTTPEPDASKPKTVEASDGSAGQQLAFAAELAAQNTNGVAQTDEVAARRLAEAAQQAYLQQAVVDRLAAGPSDKSGVLMGDGSRAVTDENPQALSLSDLGDREAAKADDVYARP